jgi:serine/threonine-protein kinase
VSDPPRDVESTLSFGEVEAARSLEASESVNPPREREVIAGRYEILALLGTGGMGAVYRARDIELDEIVAFKVLRANGLSADDIERFRREVKLARRVTHTNVARVYDIGEHAGVRFLTMELIEGESVASLLGRQRPLPLEQTLTIASSVAMGLGAIHAAGVVHRDLKPDNVLIAKDGRVVIADFGIARSFAGETGPTATSNMAIGTPAYMAPEQVEGRNDVDARADVYALGCMLYELATGRLPFPGDVPLAVAAIRLVVPAPDPRLIRPELPAAFAELILRCMRLRREERFATADEIAQALAALTALATATQPLPLVKPTPAASRGGAGTSLKSVAVLPFTNAGAPGDDYIADELCDDLIDALSMTPNLRVSSRGVVARFRGAVDPREVGQAIGVQVIVDGKVRVADGRLRLSVRISSVEDGFLLWVNRFDRPAAELLSVSDEVAIAIADALTVAPRGPVRPVITDAVALDLYLRGRQEYRRFWAESQRRAIAYFHEAIGRAPGTPTFLAALALSLCRLSFFDPMSLVSARRAAEEALRVAPEMPEVRLALGSIELQSGNFVEAVRQLKRTIAGGPGLAEAHGALGRILCEAGGADVGIRYLEAAISLDPHVSLAHTEIDRMRLFASEEVRTATHADSSQLAVGDGADLVIRARLALWRRERNTVLAGDSPVLQNTLPALLVELIANPTVESAERLQTHLKDVDRESPGSLRRQIFFSQLDAEVSAYMGDEARALESIRGAVRQGLFDVPWLDSLGLFDALRRQPDWQPLRATVQSRAAAILAAYRSD